MGSQRVRRNQATEQTLYSVLEVEATFVNMADPVHGIRLLISSRKSQNE